MPKTPAQPPPPTPPYSKNSKKFGKIRKTYFYSEKLTLVKMFENVLGFVKFVFGFVGINIFDENHKYANFLFISTVSTLTSYYFVTFYDIYLFRKDFVRVAFCMVTLGIVCCVDCEIWISFLKFQFFRLFNQMQK
jgi:hypothetical protein